MVSSVELRRAAIRCGWLIDWLADRRADCGKAHRGWEAARQAATGRPSAGGAPRCRRATAERRPTPRPAQQQRVSRPRRCAFAPAWRPAPCSLSRSAKNRRHPGLRTHDVSVVRRLQWLACMAWMATLNRTTPLPVSRPMPHAISSTAASGSSSSSPLSVEAAGSCLQAKSLVSSATQTAQASSMDRCVVPPSSW